MATVNVGTLEALLTLRDQLSPGLLTAQSSLTRFARTAGVALAAVTAVVTAAAAALAAFVVSTTRAAMAFESSFTGIRKTVQATEEQFRQLADGMRELSLQIPVNVNELNRIGEAAGQLGIQTEHILGFTETMAQLGVTTNLSSDEAATALARLANITQMPQTAFDRLGSTVVALGNSMATTEAEIVTFGLRIAGAGEMAGLTEANILSIGAAMSSVGVQAEAGGTSVQKVLISMTKAAATGGDQLASFASAAGMSAEQFATAFERDAAGAFTAFVEGLGRSGTKAFAILDELGLKDQRLIRSFLSLANAGDVLRTSIDLGTEAWAANTALAEEAALRFDTTASKLEILRNHVGDLAISLGDMLLPLLNAIVDSLTNYINGAIDSGSATRGMTKAVVLLLDGLILASSEFKDTIVLWNKGVLAVSKLERGIVNMNLAVAEWTATTKLGRDAQQQAGITVQDLRMRQGELNRRIVDAEAVIKNTTSATGAWREKLETLKQELANTDQAASAFVGPVQASTRAVDAMRVAVTQATPELLTTRDVIQQTGQAATRAAVDFDRFTQTVLVNRLETARLHRMSGGLTERLAAARRGVLETSASFAGFTPIIQTVTGEAGTLSSVLNPPGGFFAGVTSSARSLIDGLTGGDGLAGFFSGIGTGMVNELGAILTGGLSSLIDVGIGLVGKGLKKIGGMFKSLFGGPSAKELGGREVEAQFALTLESMLSNEQKMEAGNERWKMTVIAVRDRYIELGLTEQQALDDVARMWDAIKRGPGEVNAAIDIITNRMAGVTEQAQATSIAMDEAFRSRVMEISVEPVDGGSGTSHPDPTGGFARGTGGRFVDFGRGTAAVLHGRERISTEAEGRAEAAGFAAMAQELAAIKRQLGSLPQAIKTGMRSAVEEVVA